MNQLELYDLICEYQSNPLGLGETRPRLGWKLRTPRRGARQTAYRITAAHEAGAFKQGTALVWDSGRVESGESVQIEYGGPPLRSSEQINWQVQVWDEAGNVTQSDPARWEMGLLDRLDWEPAQWIAGPLFGGVWTTVPQPYLRRAFSQDRDITQARLYVTSLGLYECWINGARVGKDWFTPGWTDYKRRVQYQVYDVTELLHEGENVWGAILGDGWYCGHVSHSGRQAYGDRPKFFGKLVVTSDDGSTQTIVTDKEWRVSYGALLGSDNYNGEIYDARLEQRGWDQAAFDASRWMPVDLVRDPGIELSANFGAPVRTVEEILPISAPNELTVSGDRVWIFDFGQNMAGRARLRVHGEPGETLRLRFAEMLNPDGSIYTANLRSALQTDIYILKGNEEESWEPRFTYHGFRYVELSGYPREPQPEMLTAIVMHSEMRPTGAFQCSEPLVNQLHHNIVWGQKSNFFDVPTDCPFRDERLGWTGDTQLFYRTAAFNMDIAEFSYKWLRDVQDAQSQRGAYPTLAPRPRDFLWEDGGPAWGEAGVICPWTLYLVYGDKRILERKYDSMQRFFEFLQNTSDQRIRPVSDGRSSQGFGDWMALDAPTTTDGTMYSAWQGGTPKPVIGTAFFAYTAALMSRIAGILDRPSDAAIYAQEFESIRNAFLQNFVSADGQIQGDTQTGYALAINFDLLPDALRQRSVNHLIRIIQARDMHLSTGFVGTPYLAHALTKGGRPEVAYTLLLQRTYPSWLYPILNGATTIWERWNGWTPDSGFQDPAMNSFNHFALGAIGDWLYRVVAGIEIDEDNPGYRNIVLQPHPKNSLDFARGTYESLYGTIVSDWSIVSNKFDWHVTIPPNTTATLYIPSKTGPVLEAGVEVERREGIVRLEKRHDTFVCTITAGQYQFESFL